MRTCVCVCGLLMVRCSAIINKASQLSRQRCSLTACLQTLDHLVLLSTSGLMPQYFVVCSGSFSLNSLMSGGINNSNTKGGDNRGINCHTAKKISQINLLRTIKCYRRHEGRHWSQVRSVFVWSIFWMHLQAVLSFLSESSTAELIFRLFYCVISFLRWKK